MLIKKPSDMRYSEVTPKYLYMNRRNFLAGAAAAAGVAEASLLRTLSPPGKTAREDFRREETEDRRGERSSGPDF